MARLRNIMLLLSVFIIGVGVGHMTEENVMTTTDINSISLEEYDKLKTDYTKLQETIDAVDAKNLTRMNVFTLIQDTEKQFTYDAGNGVIWVIDVSHIAMPETRFSCTMSWRKGEDGAIVNNGWKTLETINKEVTGSIETEIYENSEYITIKSTVTVDGQPELTRIGIVNISKTQ